MKELNPNHSVTKEMHDNWHKIVALILKKLNLNSVTLTDEEITQIALDPGGINVAIHASKNSIRVFLVNDAEADKLAKQEGGLLH